MPFENLTVIHENCRAKVKQKSKLIDENLINIDAR